MKHINLKTEWIIWVIVSIPIVLLFVNWNQIPLRVPSHYGIDGNPDKWSEKTFFAWFVPVLSLISYILLVIIPYIDPKNRILAMGAKYFSLRLIIATFLSLFLILLVFASYNPNVNFIYYLYPLMALLFIVIGNYLPSVKPNYFIGLRTPWALHDDKIWQKTHRFASKVFMIGGIVLMILWFLFYSANFKIYFLIGLMSIVFIPVVYSYVIYRKFLENQ